MESLLNLMEKASKFSDEELETSGEKAGKYMWRSLSRQNTSMGLEDGIKAFLHMKQISREALSEPFLKGFEKGWKTAKA